MKKCLLVLSIRINGKLHQLNHTTDYLYDISSAAPGYYIIGIVGVSINSGWESTLVNFDIINNQLKIRVYNAGTTDVIPDSIYVKLLYSKYKPTAIG